MDNPENDLKPWERQADEPRRWYLLFETFRLMGPNRSLIGAYQSFWVQRASASYKESGKPIPKHASGGWRKRAEQFHWRDRAIAWDEWCAEQAREADAARRKQILSSGYAKKESRIALLNQLAALLGGDPNIRLNKELGGSALALFEDTGAVEEKDPGGEVFEEEKRWVPDVKSIGSGLDAERVDIVRFNEGIINQLRGVLSDIAAEVGDRRQQSQNTNLDLDVGMLTDEQLERIANGEDPLNVLATPSTGGD